MVTDRDTGKPKGFAFCEFYDIPTAVSAQRNLHGYEFNGRKLRVDFADEQQKADRKGRAPLLSCTQTNKEISAKSGCFKQSPRGFSDRGKVLFCLVEADDAKNNDC